MTLPAIDDLSTFGGILSDYTEVVDPTTDLPALASNQVRADVAAMTRLCPRAFVIWTNDGSDGTVVTFDSVVGSSSSYYPTYYPTITKQATGHWRLTFTASVTDFLGETQFWNFRYGEGCMLSSTFGTAQVVKVAPNIVDAYLFDAAGAASDFAGSNILTRVY
ncbi:hypothetical protein [Polyangium spumosum]|uniref:Uncharacterized protein n=1 Tax=Polyangium spumosum TaxID=889282 RepID=A0A6N7Q146_9BACT|nr:hypothetical protein [Polyangium spumosum]MRG98202.1 hypothetical protein [Polyangium spumosum]